VVGFSLAFGSCLAGLAEEFDSTHPNPDQLIVDEVASGGSDPLQGLLLSQGFPPPGPFGPGGPDSCGGPGGGFGPGGPGGPFMHGGPGMPPPPPGMGPMMLPLGSVDLTDDQVEKLAAVRHATHEKVEPVMTKLHALERDFMSALTQPVLNADELSRLRVQISTQKQALDAHFTDSVIASAQILTAEQRKQIRLEMNRAELGPQFRRKESSAK
jgi:Spy/CpxP family protein refolding chaperone